MSRTPTADKVIAVAKREVGYHEGRNPNGVWNNHQKYSPDVPGLEWSQEQAWCATFISWVAIKAGVATLFPRTASTDVAASWYQQRKQWSEYPAIGAQGFLADRGDEHHTFLVVDYDSTYVYTVEGNSNQSGSSQGDGVYGLRRRRRDTNIEGYGYPAYPEGIVSADPAWAHRAPKAVSQPKPHPAAPVPAVAPPRPRSATLRVAEDNVMSLPKNPEVSKTILANPASSVLMLQEMDLAAFHNVLRHLPGYTTGSIPEGNTYNAFVVFKPRVWQHVSTKFVKQYDGIHGISLTRHIAVTVLRHKALGQDFAFVSYHRVTAGNDKHRRALRKEGDGHVRAEITRLRAAGLPVILGTDQNGTSNLFPSRDIHIRDAIVHQYAWSGKHVALHLDDHHTVATRSDHDTLVGHFTATIK